jgi:hypothetical protein
MILVLVLCLPLTARADEASQRAKAKQMLVVLHVESQVQQAAADMQLRISAIFEKEFGSNPAPENKAKLADAEKKISQLIEEKLSWKVLEPSFVEVYAKAFTEQEMDQIIAFYKTPGGTALIQKMPAIDAQVDQNTRSKVGEIQPQINQLYNDLHDSLAAQPASPATMPSPSGITLAPAASTAK